MFEKVNPAHPDKIADRIAGAIVDLAYKAETDPKIAVEVLIGHGNCHVIIETNTHINTAEIDATVKRIAGNVSVHVEQVAQDVYLSANQADEFRCGDNGIFTGVPVNTEEEKLARIARDLYAAYPSDGKHILDGDQLIICQSCANTEKLRSDFPSAVVNPLGDWTGGTDVDTGATNRKLGSDMGRAVTGGGLHGKDLSKADVSVNIYAHLKAQETGEVQRFCCAIGDTKVDGKPYGEIVAIARDYINRLGGFEQFAKWGLIR
ncbi:S-adenosylmethionine synthetase N-terminal domain-containing protein [Actinotignum urinale]|uniref:S-adenosylmethionine synthetase N-terminal domain-containing protein n=1 Tax=Actinotignum urinale TaxID=190146 RepID=UPI0003B4DEA3|nr:S-adenosylmethionine synthetase N-terminal domain-containing protein [Actinotignum urinale]MDY5159658.1 S-adenosylmethionine synthetase N-terminal domain-containing protein [Actinotignum urinale]